MGSPKYETVPIKSLVLDPSNVRKHNDKNIEAIKGSLAKFGQQKPIVVTEDNVVIAGNGTLMAAKAIGWEKIDVHRTVLKGAEAVAFALADNRTAELAEWDDAELNKQLLALDAEGWEMGDLGFDDPVPPSGDYLTDPDAVPETKQNEFCVERGQIWQLGAHRLMCGDSTSAEDVATLMGGENTAFSFTSPPYADQREYCGNKMLSTKHLAKFLNAASLCADIFAVNLGISRKDGEINQYWNDYIEAAKFAGLKLLSWNVWDKGECGSVGNQTAMFGISHEWIFIFGRAQKKLNRTVPNKSAGELANHSSNRMPDGSTKKQKDRIVGDFSQLKTVCAITAQKARDDIDHPARFPVALPTAYIEACCDSDDIVYEPFCGSGSTLIACEKTGRKCFGMEIDPYYCSVIIKRWQDFTGKKAELHASR